MIDWKLSPSAEDRLLLRRRIPSSCMIYSLSRMRRESLEDSRIRINDHKPFCHPITDNLERSSTRVIGFVA